MKPIDRVREFVQERDQSLQVIELAANTATAPLAAAALGTSVGQIAKSILFKRKDDRYLMVVAAGDVRLDARAVKNLAGGRVRMASTEEVMAVTGFPVGGVCPFAISSEEIDIYLDASLLDYDIVYAAAGSANSALPISYDQLVNVTGGRPCQVSQKSDHI